MPGKIPRSARVHAGLRRHLDSITGSGPSGDWPSGVIKWHVQRKAYAFQYILIFRKSGLLSPKNNKLSRHIAGEL